MKKVSVIVPVYNVEVFLSRCLESILQQTYQNFEIICVDDCGQDKSMDIVSQYKEKYPDSIKCVHHNENKGLGFARDTGMKIAEGEYLLFVDSDDYIKENYIETYVKCMEENDLDVAVGGYIRDNNGALSEYRLQREKDCFWVYVTAWAKMYRKSFLEEKRINFRGIRRYEDEQFTYRILMNNPKIAILDYSGYYYFNNSASITQNKSVGRTNLVLEYIKSIEKFYFEVKEHAKNEGMQEIIEYCLIAGLIANALYNGRGCGVQKMKKIYEQVNSFFEVLEDNPCNNRYVSLKYLKSEAAKKRYATWLIVQLRRIKLEWLVFLAVSLM